VSEEYQVVGTDLNASNPFILDASKGEKITLDVSPGVHQKVVTGGVILGSGAAVIIGGTITLIAASKSNTVSGANGSLTDHSNTDAISIGTTLIVAGAVAGIFGGAMMIDNSHTKVEGAVGASPDKPEAPTKAQINARREPTWHEDRGPAIAGAHAVPLFQGTF
jgi:hypothetical protein